LQLSCGRATFAFGNPLFHQCQGRATRSSRAFGWHPARRVWGLTKVAGELRAGHVRVSVLLLEQLSLAGHSQKSGPPSRLKTEHGGGVVVGSTTNPARPARRPHVGGPAAPPRHGPRVGADTSVAKARHATHGATSACYSRPYAKRRRGCQRVGCPMRRGAMAEESPAQHTGAGFGMQGHKKKHGQSDSLWRKVRSARLQAHSSHECWCKSESE